MKVISNTTGLPIEDMLCVTSRIGNKKRSYLLCNKLQGKYLPVAPEVPLELFEKLANLVKEKHQIAGNIIVIGFAETATAIGARIANVLSWNERNNVTFLPTTREILDQNPICEFKEEHSHAVEQLLYGKEEMFKKANYVIFAEDEITTGNTIKNCVNELRKKFGPCLKFIAASILNCQSANEERDMLNNHIYPVYLVKADRKDMGIDIEEPRIMESEISCKCVNPREGVSMVEYDRDIQKIAGKVSPLIEDAKNGEIIVLGTEECMYPAMRLADDLNGMNYCAQVSATTRVPTNIGDDLLNKHKIHSMYGERDTYLYGMKRFKTAIVVSDGNNDDGKKELKTVLRDTYGAENIIFVHLI